MSEQQQQKSGSRKFSVGSGPSSFSQGQTYHRGSAAASSNKKSSSQKVTMTDLGDTDLKTIHREHPDLFEADMDHILLQIMRALVDIWKNDIVYQDIRPANIKTRYNPTTKKFQISLKNDIQKTTSYSFVETTKFASPELLERLYTHNTRPWTWEEYLANDLWSLGMLLYFLIYDKLLIDMSDAYLFSKKRISHDMNKQLFLQDLYLFYQQLKGWSHTYDILFPTDILSEKKKKYVPTLRALLSLDPNVRLQWWEKKKKRNLLGSGSYSSVYPGQLPKTVVKEPNPSLSEQKRSMVASKYSKQYINTKHLLKNKSIAQNIVEIIGVQDGKSVMVDLGGNTLDDIIDKQMYKSKFFQDDFDNIIGQLINTVVGMLVSGVAHRDIKPENIMMSFNGTYYRPKFIDFTDSQTKNDVDSHLKTYRNFGSPWYMSPEALKRRDENNTKAGSWDEYMANDLWSLGIVLYMLLYGEHPITKLQKLKHRFNIKIPPINKKNFVASYSKIYQQLKSIPIEELNRYMFPELKDKKTKYHKDVVALLSFDPQTRIQWWKTKAKEMKQHQQREQNMRNSISMLLSAASQIQRHQQQLQRPSKRVKTSN